SSHREGRERRAVSASAGLLVAMPEPTRLRRKWQVFQTFLSTDRNDEDDPHVLSTPRIITDLKAARQLLMLLGPDGLQLLHVHTAR
ncbi:hypothetical protein, partial [Pseudotabrizicola sp.]|uniref:hypothetical protein n=1 Tax=Pseudotabrizicola sp. TaxID=2939647 RepID=UPI00271C0E4B